MIWWILVFGPALLILVVASVRYYRSRIIRCCIKDCGREARYAAGISLISGNMMSHGRIRPHCGSRECLEKMEKVEQTKVTLTPIGISIYSVMKPRAV